MKTIQQLRAQYRTRKRTKNYHELLERSCDLFQLKEYLSEIWLTYDGNLICPVSFLKGEPVSALQEIRKLYVQRNQK